MALSAAPPCIVTHRGHFMLTLILVFINWGAARQFRGIILSLRERSTCLQRRAPEPVIDASCSATYSGHVESRDRHSDVDDPRHDPL